jgi:RNA polymerase sigma-70 factor (ECF subfamily)
MKEPQPSLCEEDTFTAVFSEYGQPLFRYLYYKTGNTALSEDLTQEAFTKMWKNCASVIFETAKSYVFTIANNLLLNEYKHQKVVLKFQEKPQADRTIENPEYLMEEREWKDKIEAAIAALPEKQRTVFLMSRIDKKTYKEIAEVLGISKQAVEKRIYKALNALRAVSKMIK